MQTKSIIHHRLNEILVLSIFLTAPAWGRGFQARYPNTTVQGPNGSVSSSGSTTTAQGAGGGFAYRDSASRAGYYYNAQNGSAGASAPTANGGHYTVNASAAHPYASVTNSSQSAGLAYVPGRGLALGAQGYGKGVVGVNAGVATSEQTGNTLVYGAGEIAVVNPDTGAAVVCNATMTSCTSKGPTVQ